MCAKQQFNTKTHKQADLTEQVCSPMGNSCPYRFGRAFFGAKQMLDLSKLNVSEAAETGYKMQVVHPVTRQPIDGAFITIRGDDSKTVQKWIRGVIARRQSEELMAKRRGKEADPISLADAEDQANEGAAKRVISSEGIFNGKTELHITEETAKQVFAEHTWLRDQVLEASRDLGNFVKA